MTDDDQPQLTQEDRERVRAILREFRDDLPQITVELHIDRPPVEQRPAPVRKRAAERSRKAPRSNAAIYQIYEQRKKKNRAVRLKDVCAEFGANEASVSAAASRERSKNKAIKSSSSAVQDSALEYGGTIEKS